MIELKTISFKDVHSDLENESFLLKKDHDIRDFQNKGDTLESIGLTSSIATKMYSAIAENHLLIREYDEDYLSMYKFILEPQLERLCEKYNLFVRPMEYFMGDIPESNVNDITNFKPLAKHVLDKNLMGDFSNVHGYHKELSLEAIQKRLGKYISKNERVDLRHVDDLNSLARRGMETKYSNPKSLKDKFLIAAVKNMFNDKAFNKTDARIAGYEEVDPKSQVDLDPMVLFKVDGGYLIITAWGDEANDELVFNLKNN